MMKIVILVLALMFVCPATVDARRARTGHSYSHSYGTGSSYRSHRVSGYYRRSSSTWVTPHRRSNPDGRKVNNWTTYPNVNPYTGKVGTRY